MRTPPPPPPSPPPKYRRRGSTKTLSSSRGESFNLFFVRLSTCEFLPLGDLFSNVKPFVRSTGRLQKNCRIHSFSATFLFVVVVVSGKVCLWWCVVVVWCAVVVVDVVFALDPSFDLQRKFEHITSVLLPCVVSSHKIHRASRETLLALAFLNNAFFLRQQRPWGGFFPPCGFNVFWQTIAPLLYIRYL